MALFGIHAKTKSDKLAIRNARAYAFLQDHPAGVLATVDPNGYPHAAVIYYTADEYLTGTFLTKEGTKKSDNLAHNNRAMLTVFDEALQTEVQITGVVSEVTDGDELSKMFRHMLRTSLHSGRNAIPPAVKLPGNRFIGYRLKPAQVRISVYTRPDLRGPQKMIETIDIPK